MASRSNLPKMATTDLEAAAEEWRTQGWTVVHDLVPAAEIDEAVNELWQHFPTPAEIPRLSHTSRTKALIADTSQRARARLTG